MDGDDLLYPSRLASKGKKAFHGGGKASVHSQAVLGCARPRMRASSKGSWLSFVRSNLLASEAYLH